MRVGDQKPDCHLEWPKAYTELQYPIPYLSCVGLCYHDNALQHSSQPPSETPACTDHEDGQRGSQERPVKSRTS